MLRSMIAQPRRVLVIDRDDATRHLVSVHLGINGYDCVMATDGKTALRRASTQAFDLIVLDLLLPHQDGLTVCRAVRREGPNRDVPMIMLTPRRDEGDTVCCLQSGADDCLVKPFGAQEFVARVRALMRRSGATSGRLPSAPPSGRPATVARLGVMVDPARRRVVCDGMVVSLTPHEFALVHILVSHPGVVFSRDELRSLIGSERVGAPARTIDSLVRRVRRKIERDATQPTRVITVWGTGYMFPR